MNHIGTSFIVYVDRFDVLLAASWTEHACSRYQCISLCCKIFERIIQWQMGEIEGFLLYTLSYRWYIFDFNFLSHFQLLFRICMVCHMFCAPYPILFEVTINV